MYSPLALTLPLDSKYVHVFHDSHVVLLTAAVCCSLGLIFRQKNKSDRRISGIEAEQWHNSAAGTVTGSRLEVQHPSGIALEDASSH
jgi:hypothetical protein